MRHHQDLIRIPLTKYILSWAIHRINFALKKAMGRQEQMYSLVDQYHKSGLSIRAFSEEHAISHYTLSYWISKKRKTEKQAEAYRGFIPISTTPSFPPSAGTLEIIYPNGVKIRLSSMDIATIGSLIRLG